MNRFMTTALALILATGQALAAPTMTAGSGADAVLTNAAGMTLYTFDKDAEGVSNCAGECVALWPILEATATDTPEGDYAIIDRADGAKQWTYKGKPLYTFVKDAAAGDMAGDGVKDVWKIARP